jgi:hypothetical protein
MKRFIPAFVLLLALTGGTLFADTKDTTAVPYGPAEFPDWQKDLRRAEILSFGSLPFVTFMSSIYYDVYRWCDNGYASGYLLWPFKPSDGVDMTEREQQNILFASIGISVGVAVFDFGYRAFRRSVTRSQIERRNRLVTDPITIEPDDGIPSGTEAPR